MRRQVTAERRQHGSSSLPVPSRRTERHLSLSRLFFFFLNPRSSTAQPETCQNLTEPETYLAENGKQTAVLFRLSFI